MLADEVQKFVEYCRKIQPQSQENIKRFFEGVVLFPYDKELLLQAYLYLNIESIFPSSQELLLFEKAPIGINTDQGKCDFVYLTVQNKLFSIETKFIDTRAETQTQKIRRNSHRSKVIEQVLSLRDKFSEVYKIPKIQFDCGIFTTDPHITQRAIEFGIYADCISIDSLHKWQEQQEVQFLSD